MGLLRIPNNRLQDFDLVVELSVRERENAFAHEPRAETRIRIPLDGVVIVVESGQSEVADDVADAVLESVKDIVNRSAVTLPRAE